MVYDGANTVEKLILSSHSEFSKQVFCLWFYLNYTLYYYFHFLFGQPDKNDKQKQNNDNERNKKMSTNLN